MVSDTPVLARQPLLRSALPYLGLAALAFLVCWIYRQPPRLGDDLDYFRLAMELRGGVEGAWSEDSFHDLRWPVWGLIWLLMGGFGPGAAAYYLQPAIYLAAGSALVFWLAGRVGLPLWGCLCAGIFFVMHPLIDNSIIRPMPDLSEGFWVGLAFAFWLALVGEKRVAAKVALCAAVGLALAVGQANRITGAFAVPVLVVCTLAFHPRQFWWLVLAGGFALGFVLIEAAVYWAITGDFLHSIHANLGARGRKGTESLPVWFLPFRFLNSLFRHAPEILMNCLALGGMAYFWRSGGKPGRALATYAVVYFLTYSCALQSFSPPRPMVRDGDRFLASLAIPLSVLAVGGPLLVWGLLPEGIRRARPLDFAARHPWILVLLAAFSLVLLSRRELGTPDYMAGIREVVRSQPPDSVVVSHPPMRVIAQLADQAAASRLDWRLLHNILEPSPELEGLVGNADAVWISRKHAWLGNRKRSETGEQERLPALAPFLVPPFEGWTVRRSVRKIDVPEFLFLCRVPGGSAPESVLPESLFPVPAVEFPAKWELTGGGGRRWQSEWARLPDGLPGTEIFLAIEQASDRTEAARVTLEFQTQSDEEISLSLRPYFFRETSPDYFGFQIPPDATRVRVRIDLDRKARWITIRSLEVHIFPPWHP